MATGHQLATITNSCVKPPIDPKTGLSSTFHERSTLSYFTTWDGKVAVGEGNEENIEPNDGSAHLFNNTDTMLRDATALGDLTDDEFYKKLLELKEEHKRTLKMCEQLYAEKVGSDNFARTLASRDILHDDYVVEDQQPVHTSEAFNASFESLKDQMDGRQDRLKDMSSLSKPPSGKPPTTRGRPTSAKTSKATKHAWTSQSGENFWGIPSTSSTEVDFDRHGKTSFRRSNEDLANLSRNSAASKIEDMWDNFSVDEYAPRPRRPRSASLSRMSTSSKEQASEWKNRITVPKPFNLTPSKKGGAETLRKSRTLEEFQRQRWEKERQEELECQKQFKATPVPAHVYMPLYDEIIEQQESQRRKNKETSEMLLKSQEKPFKFMMREMENKKYKVKPDPSKYDKDNRPVEKKTFKAKPYPLHIFDGSVDDQMTEEEEYRRIRKEMRMKELMRSSSLPPNMASRGEEYVLGKSRVKSTSRKAKKYGFDDNPKFKPKINRAIPDFDELHRNFQNNMNNKKNAKEATVCKPFNLRTSRTVKRNHKIYDDIENDESLMRQKGWDFKNSKKMSLTKSLSSSMDTLPTKMTASAELRHSLTKSKLQKQLDNELAELEAKRRQRNRERELQRVVSSRAAANDSSYDIDKFLETKLKSHRESDRARRAEYQEQLKEIEQRVGQRPLLFERTAQANAQKAAERRYLDTLKRAGIDEEFVSKKGSLAGSVYDDQDFSDEDDKSYNYSSHRSKSATPGRTTSATLSRTTSAAQSRTASATHSRTASHHSSIGSDIQTEEDFSDVDEVDA